MKRKVINVLLTALPVIATGFLGSFFMMIAKIDYESLAKPLFAPKGIVFPIAWSILYLLIIISGYLFLKDKVDKEMKIKGMIVYYIGLIINAFWTFFFFTLDLKVFSIIWLVLLYIVSASNYVIFFKKSKISGYLLIPYLVWLLFAMYLNIGIAILN